MHHEHAHSHARFLASWFMAALVAAYTLPLLMATTPATEELKTTEDERPLACAARASMGFSAWHSANVAVKLVPTTASYSSAV
jgi:hypothetical protein